MLPTVLGVVIGLSAEQWNDSEIDWEDPHTWPNPLDVFHDFPYFESRLLTAILLPVYLPIFLAFTAGWINFLYSPPMALWFVHNFISDDEPNYSRWVPGLTSLQAWAMVLSFRPPHTVITWIILISSTVTAALITYYLGWYRPRRLLHEIDTERDLMREDLIEEIPTKENSVSEA